MNQGQMVAKIALQRMLSTKLPEFGLVEHCIAFANIYNWCNFKLKILKLTAKHNWLENTVVFIAINVLITYSTI